MSNLLKDSLSKESLMQSNGFNPKFISSNTLISFDKILSAKQKKLLPVVEGNTSGILNYDNLSVLYNTERKIPFVCIYGIDGAQKVEGVKRTTFRTDPRIEKNIQLGNSFYDLRKDITEFEIGHMAANNEMAWGNFAQRQSYQTFHFPNSVPQAENLNSGIWRDLEQYIIKEASTIILNQKIVVLTGPVIQQADPFYVKDKTFKIPLLFFKIIIFSTIKGVYATAFIMSHEQKMIEDEMLVSSVIIRRGVAPKVTTSVFEDYKYKEVFQVNLSTVQELTGFKLTWKGVKHLKIPNSLNQLDIIKKVKGVDSIPRASRGGKSVEASRLTTLILP